MFDDTSPKILIVEDEDSIRQFISLNLKRNHFNAYEASTGEEAIELLNSICPDIVILDLMLPGINGFDVCTKVRAIYPETFIIMLTAKNQDMDKIRGLEIGADDYIVKPFNLLELLARIRALLRRSRSKEEGTNNSIIHSGGITIDLTAQKLYINGKEIDATPREFLLLKVLVENSNKALTRDDILNLAWGKDFMGDYKTVDVHIRKLREKIEDDSANPKLIQTVWGYGYRYEEVK